MSQKNPVNIRKYILLKRFLALVNMSAAQMKAVLDNPEYAHVSMNSQEASKAGAGVLAGREASKVIQKFLSRVNKFRNSNKLELPNLTDHEWFVLGRAVAFISRYRDLPGSLYQDNGEPSDRAIALQIWGHNQKTRPNVESKETTKTNAYKLVRKALEKGSEQNKKDEK